MAAELLRLRLRILANGFRASPARLLGLVLVLVIALGGTVLLVVGAGWLRPFGADYAARVTTVVGSWLGLAALIVPIMAIRRPVLSARAFLGYGISSPVVALTLLSFVLIGPGILLVPIAVAPVAAWPDAASVQVAWAAAPLIFVQGLVSIAFGQQAGVALRRRPRLAGWVDVVGFIVLLLGAGLAIVVLADRAPMLAWVHRVAEPLHEVAQAAPGWLASTPFGMLWAAPGAAATGVGEPHAAWQALSIAALVVVVVVVAWFGLVAYQLRPTRRLPGPRRTRVPGLFARFPASPAGAIAARSVTYWIRDPRYHAVFAVMPLVPVLSLLALWVGGVPFSISVLVPLPVMTLLLAWSTIHNDVAFDHTAIWQHVAAQTRGSDDRSGRAVPVLLWGVVLLAVGVPLTAWAHGNAGIVPALTGVCAALLLGGIGIGNLYSARFPYAAPRPGDAAWQSPQVAGSQGGVAQAVSLGLTLLVALPAFVAAALWWIDGGAWGWASLGAGLGAGLIAFLIGARGGGAVFDRRAPELLAFTLRN